MSLTFVTLLFDFKLFGEILIVFPLYLCTDRTVVDEVASVSQFVPEEIGLLEDFILEVVVGIEMETDLESGLALLKVRESDILEVFQSASVAIRYELGDS